VSEYTEEEYQERVEAFNEIVVDYTLEWSNFEEAAHVSPDLTLSLAEIWFNCPACGSKCGAEQMYLLQRNKKNGRVVMQSLSTFYDVTPDGNYSGVEAIFDLGATVVIMACRTCVEADGHDPDSVEIIPPEYKESKLV